MCDSSGKSEKDPRTRSREAQWLEYGAVESKERRRLSLESLRHAALKSCAEWNQELNEERKEEQMEQPSSSNLQVQVDNKYPSRSYKAANPLDRKKVGSFPFALIHGQFSDTYERYTSDELLYLPLDTVLYGPVVDNRVICDSDTDSDVEYSSSNSESSSTESSSMETDSGDDGSSSDTESGNTSLDDRRLQSLSSGSSSDCFSETSEDTRSKPKRSRLQTKVSPKSESVLRTDSDDESVFVRVSKKVRRGRIPLPAHDATTSYRGGKTSNRGLGGRILYRGLRGGLSYRRRGGRIPFRRSAEELPNRDRGKTIPYRGRGGGLSRRSRGGRIPYRGRGRPRKYPYPVEGTQRGTALLTRGKGMKYFRERSTPTRKSARLSLERTSSPVRQLLTSLKKDPEDYDSDESETSLVPSTSSKSVGPAN